MSDKQMTIDITTNLDELTEYLLKSYLECPDDGQRSFEECVRLLNYVASGKRPFAATVEDAVEQETRFTTMGLGALAAIKVLLHGVCRHEMRRADCVICSSRVLSDQPESVIVVKTAKPNES